MGVRIAVVIALTTLASYLHLLDSVRTEALERLEGYVKERSQREQSIFTLARDNQALLAKALEEKLRAPAEAPEARFERLFAQLPDGTVRSRREGFDGTRMPCVFVPKGVALEAGLRQRILASYDVVAQYGPAFHTRFTNTFITLPEGPLILYWPSSPTWCQDAEPDFSVIALDFFPGSRPENNPKREMTWSAIFADTVANSWVVVASTPLDLDGRHVATLSHDVLLKELMARVASDRLPGAYNMLFRDDGQLIAHPELDMEGATAPYATLGEGPPAGDKPTPLGAPEQRAHLRRLVERVKARAPGENVVQLPGDGEYLGVARLDGPGWNFVTVMPRSVVSQPAFHAARYVLLFGVASLLLELGIMFWVLREQITRPLLAFTQATTRVAAGDFQVALNTSRRDELGQLARAFWFMANEVQRREEALRQANEGLEQRVEQRTRELKEAHQKLVESARQAGMAEIATSVLHNVGNVLNSVITSAQIARERVAGSRLEQVGRVASMLGEHQGDLVNFLVKDERGQHVVPFLERLGKHLVDERQEVVSMLDDVGRYTEHIGTIVKLQQGYAKPPVVQEPVQLAELVEDALGINASALSRHGVAVERHLAFVPPVMTDKHKVLMILVNLISNAKHALHAVPVGQKRLTVVLERSSENRVVLEVRDNGMGIEPELLIRIFQHGFTTREDGHGFGLHSSALAARDLGGSLEAHSEGPGRGATFRLVLPYAPTQVPPR
jgi:C4-dicarboxylate-specific signal transduction histidine kinase